MGFAEWVRTRLVTPDAVYGLILYTALIGGVSDGDHNALEVLLLSGASLLIFWGAHVYAGTLAGHGTSGFRKSLWGAMKHSSGMLYASILPSIPLVLASFSLISADDGSDYALLIAMVVLGLLCYKAFAARKSPIFVRILGGIGTALFGFLMIILNLIVH